MDIRVAHARTAVESWELGQTSRLHESGNRGAGTISSGRGDHGGRSYGAYQLSSRAGTLEEYLTQSRYGPMFRGLVRSTPDFDRRWKEIAEADPGFGKDQHQFIRKTHYDVQMARLKEVGLDFGGRGRAVKDAVWSTSVQFRDLTRPIFEKGLEEKYGRGYRLDQLSDADIITAVQDYKVAHNERLFRSSPTWWPGLMARARSEKADLLGLCENERVAGLLPQAPAGFPHGASKAEAVAIGRLALGSEGDEVVALQRLLNHLGYRDELGRSLVSDGDFGRRTAEALKAFQFAHGLEPVGHVGPKTRAELQYARDHGPVPVDPAHPDHALHRQISRAVDDMERSLGRTADERSERLKAALLPVAKAAGVTRVDHVVLSGTTRTAEAGERVFAVQGRLDDPAHRRVHVSTQQAIDTPVQVSWQALEQANAQATGHALAQARTQSEPVRMSGAMAELDLRVDAARLSRLEHHDGLRRGIAP